MSEENVEEVAPSKIVEDAEVNELGNNCIVGEEDIMELEGTSILNMLVELAEAMNVDQYIIGISDINTMDFRIASKCVGMFFAGASMYVGANSNEEQSEALFETLCKELNDAQDGFEEGHPGINSTNVDMDLVNAFESAAIELCGDSYDIVSFFGCIADNTVVKGIKITNPINGVLFSQRLQIASLSTDLVQSREYIGLLQTALEEKRESEQGEDANNEA